MPPSVCLCVCRNRLKPVCQQASGAFVFDSSICFETLTHFSLFFGRKKCFDIEGMLDILFRIDFDSHSALVILWGMQADTENALIKVLIGCSFKGVKYMLIIVDFLIESMRFLVSLVCNFLFNTFFGADFLSYLKTLL